MASRASARAWLAVALATVAALWGALELRRPLPYGTGGDSTYYYLPNIFTVHDAILGAGRPRIEWRLGQGWNPFESGQVGVGYPPYLFATAIARLLHRPEVTLELSALFTGMLVVAVVFALGKFLAPSVRAAVAVAVCTQPSALFGVASHDFLTTLPWVTGIGLVVVQGMQDPRGFRALIHLPVLGLLEVGFFWTCHPQMFIVVNVVASVLAYGLSPSWADARRAIGALFAASLTMAVPLGYFFWLSTIVHGSKSDTHDAYALFKTSVPFFSMLKWTLFGGIFPGNVWHAGWLFFSPCLAAVVAMGLLTRRPRPVQASLVVLLLLAPAVLPHSLWFDPIVLRMRWPEKATTLTSALAVVVVGAVLGRGHARRITAGLWVAAALGAAAFMAGLATEPIPNARSVGAGVVWSETRRCLDSLGIPAGGRIAWVGGFPEFPMTKERYALPLLGLTGSGPLMAGRATAHVYENLEPKSVYEGHANLDAQWRVTVSPEKIAARDGKTLSTLRDVGVSWLIALEPSVLSPLGQPRACADSQGISTYAVAMPGEPVVPFPWAETSGVRLPLTVTRNGSLETPRPAGTVPRTNLAREMKWTHLPDGRWRGETTMIAWWWVAGTFVSLVSWFAVALALRRRAISAGPDRSREPANSA